MLNTACRARSEVGRVSSPSGAASLTPLWLPASIRMIVPARFQPHRRHDLLLFRLLRKAELFLDHFARHFLDFALFEMTQLKRTIGETDEPADGPAEMATELADLAVLAFGQRHGEPGIVALLPVEACMHRAVAD